MQNRCSEQTNSSLLISSVHFKMASTHSGKPICAPHRLGRFPSVACENVPQIHLTDEGMNLSSFQRRSPSASSFYVSLLQVIDGVMPLALCPRVVPQCPQHFRSSETEATCDGCFFSGPLTAMPWTAHPQNSSEAEQDHSGLFIPLSAVYLFIYSQTSSLNL